MSNNVIKVWLTTAYVRNEISTNLDIFTRIAKKLNIQIDLKILPWDRVYNSLVRAFREGNAPDLFSLGSTWVSTFAHLGYLAPVPDDFNIAPPITTWIDDCAHYNGVKYAVPYSVSPYVIDVRNDLFSQYDIPYEATRTWDGFYQTCLDINKYHLDKGITDHVPFGFPIKPNTNTMHDFFAFLFKTGWNFPDIITKKQFTFSTGYFYDTLEYIIKLVEINQNRPDDLQVYFDSLYNQFFNDKQSTFLFEGCTQIISDVMKARIRGEEYNGRFGIIPIPYQQEGSKTLSGGCLFAVTESCRNKEMAWEVLRHFMSEENIELCVCNNGILPALNVPFWSTHKDEPLMSMLYNEIENSISYPFHPLWRNFEVILTEMIYKMFLQFFKPSSNKRYNALDTILKDANHSLQSLIKLSWEM